MGTYLWLTTVSRKEIMTEYGFYSGKINSARGNAYRKSVRLVNKEFLPKKFHNDTYYKETDIVLRNLRRLSETGANKYFSLKEFKCNCEGKYCSGYPVVLNAALLKRLLVLREALGLPVVIMAPYGGGIRCQESNDKTPGSIKASKHPKGRAVDLQVPSVTHTLAGRQRVMKIWKEIGGGYTYCNVNGSHPNMGESVHVEV